MSDGIRNLLEKTKQCLIAARDGFDGETSLETLQQLSKLDESLLGGAIPNATLDGFIALAFALGLHRTPERRSERENIAAVACLLSRNVHIPEGETDLLSQPWSAAMKALLEEAILLKRTGQVIVYRTELVVVGNGASGKTTLLHRMKWDQFLEGATMTDGIDMTYLRIGQVYFAGRDSAGQPIYAHTISLFFKDDAIYLAVFNPRVENNLDALTQFLHMVQNSSPQARVVLATTRSDEMDMDSIMLANLRRLFPMICGVFPVDSFSGRGVDELRQFLLQEALLRPSTRTVVSASLPRTIDRIVRYAEEHKEIFSVSREQLISVMGEPNLAVEEQDKLFEQLVSFGTIYRLSSISDRFDSDPVFILHQQQLADVLACVITKNPATLARVKQLSKEGILDHSDDSLRTVWGAYPEELWRCSDSSDGRLSIFLRVLHDSGLAYEVFDKFGRPQGRSVVPCILPEKPAGYDDGDVSDESELLGHFVPDYVSSKSLEKLNISFSSMPFTFFAQLLAGLRKMATDGGAWRNGAILSAGVSYALLKEERTGISISLFGKNRSVRSVILLTMLNVMQKFHTMSILDVTLILPGRKWHEDDIKESLHYGHGVLHSAMVNIRVEVHSLWMLFPQGTKDNDSVLFPSNLPTIALEKLGEFQRMLKRAKTAKSVDFIVLINHYLQSCVSPLLHLMRAPRSEKRDGFPRPLWVVLKHQTNNTFSAVPFFPHYVPDEPWMALGAAQIPFTPILTLVDDTVKNMLSDYFAVMRGNVQDMLPSGWELAPFQSLVGVDPDLMLQREHDFFAYVDGAVYSKEFAAKAQAMRTVSVGQQPGLTSGVGSSITAPMSDGISVAAIRAFYETHVKGKMAEDCTTADMLTLVKSITKADGSAGGGQSYCQLLRRQAAEANRTASPPSFDEVGEATIFISHAWKYKFLQFLLALEAKFKDQPWVRLWIDIFCHNQHDELTSDEWITKFEQHIVRINSTVMILFPWYEPSPFTRAWSLLEVFYNAKNGVPFEVYLDEEQQMEFLDLVRQKPGETMLILSRISTRQSSTCWVLNDQLRIHSLIESSEGGFEAVNRLIRDALVKALHHVDGRVYYTFTPNTATTAGGTRLQECLNGSLTRENKEVILSWLQDTLQIEENSGPGCYDYVIHLTAREIN